MGKAAAQRRHARRRAAERYGINAGKATQAAIVRAIQAGRGVVVRRQSLRVTIYDVHLPELDLPPVRVAYDRKRGQVATFLDRDMD